MRREAEFSVPLLPYPHSSKGLVGQRVGICWPSEESGNQNISKQKETFDIIKPQLLILCMRKLWPKEVEWVAQWLPDSLMKEQSLERFYYMLSSYDFGEKKQYFKRTTSQKKNEVGIKSMKETRWRLSRVPEIKEIKHTENKRTLKM